MKLKLTDGHSLITVFFSEDVDAKDCRDIRLSPRPVTTALNLALKRLGVESGLWPVPNGVALEGVK